MYQNKISIILVWHSLLLILFWEWLRKIIHKFIRKTQIWNNENTNINIYQHRTRVRFRVWYRWWIKSDFDDDSDNDSDIDSDNDSDNDSKQNDSLK